MGFHDTIRKTITENKSKVELLQWASISAISSLIYSEYIRRFRRKLIGRNVDGKPLVQRINIPTLRSVEELVEHDSPLMERLSYELINGINKHPLIKKYKNAPELKLFQSTYIEPLKSIFDAYIIPTISREIPIAIARKFDLNNDDQKVFYQDREIDLFDRQPITDEQVGYIIEETVLQLVNLMPSIVKSVEDPDDYTRIPLTESGIITIGNSNALCPIIINKRIYEKKGPIFDLLMFVTGSSYHSFENSEIASVHNEEAIVAHFATNPFNSATITYLKELQIPETGDQQDKQK